MLIQREVWMNKRIPIKAARELAKKYKLDQVIIVAYERDAKEQEHMTHVVTYGKTKADGLQAAQGGNMVKKVLGWPDSLQALPAWVRCPKGCKGVDLGDGNFSGCNCRNRKLANGQKIPPGFECDCPNHPAKTFDGGVTGRRTSKDARVQNIPRTLK
jgi:hypothetical protein